MKIDFCFDTEYGKFCDALHLSDNHGLTDAEIEDIKKQRLANWISVITAPAPNYVTDANGHIVFDDNGNPVIAE